MLGGFERFMKIENTPLIPRRRWLKNAILVAVLFTAYVASAFAFRLAYDRRMIQPASTTFHVLQKSYAPLDRLGDICPPFRDGFEWAVGCFPAPPKVCPTK